MSILIKNVTLDQAVRDIYIEDKFIRRIGEALTDEADSVIDGTGKAAIPGFVNGHTHSAMTLFRGFGDDMPLMAWLQERIWPNEAKLTSEDIYWGSKLACLEMIKSGTTTFADMYHDLFVTADVVEEMGMRALLSSACFDHFKTGLRDQCILNNQAILKKAEGRYSDRIRFALGPHAIYTVSGELLQWINQYSASNNLPIHLHLAETAGEVADSLNTFGETPVRYLYKLGVLSPRLILAHAIYVDKEEIRILADHGVKVVHNPASNMKLASGMEFRFTEMKEAGVTIGLGTDGCASSNNLDMVEAMKLAALLGKAWHKNPEANPATDMFAAATEEGAKIVGIHAGLVKEGYLADLSLVDLKIPAFTPNFNFVSNLVYAANGSCVDTVICDGKVIMENKKVAGEDEILERSSQIAFNLINR